ncbi:hypothetical protein L1987_23626 [Smallanthus sonchifolius]|uniref:Uncharacterized protein n=1 Tax=Smallanthus sonchifolius TaxID=185202 RepID=A0ACB9IIR3_9ASTR|nr:hypothetical protein L1987_23626 [Smallanthus sonchifolius]
MVGGWLCYCLCNLYIGDNVSQVWGWDRRSLIKGSIIGALLAEKWKAWKRRENECAGLKTKEAKRQKKDSAYDTLA